MKGFLDRKKDPLPLSDCRIIIYIKDAVAPSGEEILCDWLPYNEERRKRYEGVAPGYRPAAGYIGTARRISGIPIGWNAWEQNEAEFRYYKLVSP